MGQWGRPGRRLRVTFPVSVLFHLCPRPLFCNSEVRVWISTRSAQRRPAEAARSDALTSGFLLFCGSPPRPILLKLSGASTAVKSGASLRCTWPQLLFRAGPVQGAPQAPQPPTQCSKSLEQRWPSPTGPWAVRGSLQLSALLPHRQRTQARGASSPGELVRRQRISQRALRADLSWQPTEAWAPR